MNKEQLYGDRNNVSKKHLTVFPENLPFNFLKYVFKNFHILLKFLMKIFETHLFRE